MIFYLQKGIFICLIICSIKQNTVGNRLARQADSGMPRHPVLSLVMALSMVGVFRMRAAMATMGSLSLAMRRSMDSAITGLCPGWRQGRLIGDGCTRHDAGAF
jgi:hypothetical protein